MDLITVVSISGVTLFGTKNAITSYFNKQPKSATSFLLIFGMLFLFWIKRNILESRDRYEKQKIVYEAINLQEKVEKNFLCGIPDNKLLKSWYNQASKTIKDWDPESKLIGFNYYITVGGKNENYLTTPEIQVVHWSDLKRLSRIVYIPNMSTDYNDDFYGTKNRMEPFFAQHKNWRDALKIIYRKIDDILGPDFKLQITSGNQMSFNFYYNQGKISKSERFEFNGSEIIEKKSNEIISRI